MFLETQKSYDLSAPFIPEHFLLQANDLRELDLNVLKSRLVSRVDPQGDSEFRQAICADLATRGIVVDRDWIVVTTGSQQAIDCLMRTVPPTTVLMQEPGYAHARACALKFGHTVLPFSEDRLVANPTALVYLMPRFSNPLGQSFSVAEQAKLRTILNRHSGPVIEDGWMDELAFSSMPISIVPLCPDKFIYLGSMTKKLFPGLRVGYCVISDTTLRAEFIVQKSLTAGSGSLFAERLVLEVMQSGLWEKHLVTLRSRLASQYKLVNQFLSGVAKVTDVDGGILCWVFPNRVVDFEFLNKQLKLSKYVLRSPSQFLFSLSKVPIEGFPLSFARCDRDILELLRGILCL